MVPRLLLMATLCVGLALPLGAEEAAGAADEAAIRQVIEAQLDAFREDDAALAFSFASPTIQQKFATAATFLEMVKAGYRPVYRPREVEFRDLVVEGGLIVQEVFVVGPAGEPVLARYIMERQPDGSWKINGCVLDEAPDVNA